MPLSYVERYIRSYIAAERISAKMGELNKQLQNYYRESISSKDGVKPADVDVKAFAEEAGFKYLMTTRPDGQDSAFPVLVSQDEAEIMDLLPAETLRQIYNSTPLPNAPQRVGEFDPENNAMQRFNPPTEFYVFRAIETKAQYRPEYEDIKDKVAEAWKLHKAADLAKEAAEQFEKSVKAENADFDKLAAESKTPVVETEKFSWFKSSFGAYGSYAQPSEIREAGVEVDQADRDNKEIVAPGWKFYETVFGLEQGGIGSCANQPKDRYFVVKVVEKDAPETENLEKIASDQSVSYVMETLRSVRLEQFHQDFIEQLRAKSGFEWQWIPRVEENR